ncbi:MAG: nucleotidyltransferase [Pseudomonadota bacterium]|nr:nucleotidyltransferase [Pseudomonadota bacterium]QKK05112.1 MAG: nucleotidyltransferase [Pseudomonadota bacterium]
MMIDRRNKVLKSILEFIELPERAYEIAEKRYQDIGEWFQRPESTCFAFDPHFSSQGSFRLGTAIKPDKNEEYDLDIGCNLHRGLSKEKITQEQLKVLVGDELEQYRVARQIQESLKEKARCWRLEYADDMSFHMDVVPCIPEGEASRATLRKRMIETTGLDETLAMAVAGLAVSITDNTDMEYKILTNNWRISNPEGFARWFESRMRTASVFLTERESVVKASIDTLPYYRWKTPLQSAIQLFKRHRDTMFKGSEEAKPISVIITTLAAHAYGGEGDLVSALSGILNSMELHIKQHAPYVPNPVNPEEDFADKWHSPEHAHLKLQENFFRWLLQAKADFAAVCSKNNSRIICEAAGRGLSVNLDKTEVEQALGISSAVVSPVLQIQESDPRPWYDL